MWQEALADGSARTRSSKLQKLWLEIVTCNVLATNTLEAVSKAEFSQVKYVTSISRSNCCTGLHGTSA